MFVYRIVLTRSAARYDQQNAGHDLKQAAGDAVEDEMSIGWGMGAPVIASPATKISRGWGAIQEAHEPTTLTDSHVDRFIGGAASVAVPFISPATGRRRW
jgi:hypothetical protein